MIIFATLLLISRHRRLRTVYREMPEPNDLNEIHAGPGTRELAFGFRFQGVRGRAIVYAGSPATSRGQRNRDVADEEGR